MTLIELLLSLSVLAIIGTITVTMLFSMSRGTADGREVRSRNLRLEVLCARVDARVRSSVRVLAADAKSLVLWLGDDRRNSMPDASELCRIEWDSKTGTVTAYAAEPGMAAGNDVKYTFSTDFDSVSRGLVAAGILEPEALSRKIKKWTVVTAGAPAFDAWRSVTYRVELENDAGSDHMSVAALRGE